MDDKTKFTQACEHFNSREFFEAHEVWEDLWHEAGGARHPYLQCLIQVAVALHHAGNDNFNGARKLLASALVYLEKGRPAAVEVNLDGLRDAILDFETGIQKRLAGDQAELPYFVLPLK